MKILLNSKHTRMSTLFAWFAALVLVFFGFASAAAQTTGSISVEKPDISAYPLVTTSFRAIGPDGDFIKDIKPGEFRVIENNATVTSYTLEMERVGVRFFVAFNESPILTTRYYGVSRFDRLKVPLFNWISSQSTDSLDEFSLVTAEGPVSMDPEDPESWKNALAAYQPDLRIATPGMASLSNAVDNALTLDPQSKKQTALLFITPLPTESQVDGMKEIIARAQANDIRVYVWLVGPTEYGGTTEARALQQYAESTGGQYVLFSGLEELPELADLLNPMAYLYHLSYTTSANVSGEYALVLHIKRGEVSLDSEPVTYSLRISPPNPIFLSPPVSITREWTETKRKSDSVLTPLSTDLKIMVEFVDKIDRGLAFSRLFVDGKLEDENTSEPFTSFRWDLSNYVSSGQHLLQVFVEDTAGLKGQTIEIPVDITVEEQVFTFWDRVLDKLNPVNAIIAIAILLVLIVGMVALVRAAVSKFRTRRKKKSSDPVTQPVTIEGSYTLTPEKPEEIVKWPVIRGLGLAPARLLQKRSASPPGIEYLVEIPLGNDEIIIGSDRKKADYVLVHPSVSQRHSRIFKDTDGNYRIADAGSSSGTWVNYAPVSTRGVSLEHGDLVQFGRLVYIFEVHGTAPKRVQVLPYKED